MNFNGQYQQQQQQQQIESIGLRCPSASSSISAVSPSPSSDSGHSTSPTPSEYLNSTPYNNHQHNSFSHYYNHSTTPFNNKPEPFYNQQQQYYQTQNYFYNYSNDSNYYSRNSSSFNLEVSGAKVVKRDSLKIFSIDAILGRKEEKKPAVSVQHSLPPNSTDNDRPQTNEKRKRKKKCESEVVSSNSKRIRTIFSPEQLERLEEEFLKQQYMVGTERSYLATALNLTESQVKIWFQNRRIKWRKTNVDEQNLTCLTDLNEKNQVNDSNLLSPSNQSFDSSSYE